MRFLKNVVSIYSEKPEILSQISNPLFIREIEINKFLKLSTLANILLTEKDISVSEINLLIEYVKGIIEI